MVVRKLVKKGTYYDSVLLLKISQKAASYEGVKEAAVVMGTPPNLNILRDLGLYDPSFDAITPNDLIIAIDTDENDAEKFLAKILDDLTGERKRVERDYFPKSLETALQTQPESNFVAISVPGEHASLEASDALDRGLNTFIFSSNVPPEEEKELKEKGRAKGLLVLGPDCGTVIVNGAVLGFGNVLKRGNVGIVASASTGIQEVSCQLDRMGVGISHAIGTGGNDLSEDIGGIAMMDVLGFLERDEATKVIVIISKPPAPAIEEKILQFLVKNVRKPVVANFIGGDPRHVREAGFVPAYSLDEAGYKAAQVSRGRDLKNFTWDIEAEEDATGYEWDLDTLRKIAEVEWSRLSDDQQFVRGLFCGGTLCYEAQLVLREFVGPSYSNSPLNPEYKLSDPFESIGHTVVDLGGEEFVAGRLHPMIDPTIRKTRLKKEGVDTTTAVILLDFVLGYGCHPDPAGALLDEFKHVKKSAEEQGRHIPIVASVVGTEGDPQVLSAQESKLRDAGVTVLTSNAQAAAVAGFISTRGRVQVKL